MLYTVVGIDPGWSGGAALIGPTGAQAIKFTGKNEFGIMTELNKLLMFADVCYIERVHSFPNQGVASTFKFGKIYGFLRACVMECSTPIIDVTPYAWQKALDCLSGGDKNVTKQKAQELFPGIKITHATADALLIAEYGRRRVEDDMEEANERMFL